MSVFRRSTACRFVCALSIACAVSMARPASTTAQQEPVAAALIPIPTRTYIGFNPLGLPADIGTVEIESAVLQGFTVGGTGSYIDAGDDRFTTFEFKVRYYPGDVVLRGFSVGATLGYTRFANKVHDIRETLDASTFGMVVDYNWLLGRSEHFLVGTGLGAKRVLASKEDRERADVARAIVTARVIFGFAF